MKDLSARISVCVLGSFILQSVAVALLMIPVVVQKAEAIIVNINARANSQANPVEVFLEAGTYQANPIGTEDRGTYDAWTAWSSTNCGSLVSSGKHNCYNANHLHLSFTALNVEKRARP